MLTDLDLKPNYRSGRDALLTDFYIPCLQEAVAYDRAVGYFSSSLMHVTALAYSDFALRDSRMRLVCSPALSPEDFDAMKSAQEVAEAMQETVRQHLREMLAHPETVAATKLLATLVGAGIVDVRLAFLAEPTGIFHDKVGIFTDMDGRRISFVGSANETWAAWGLNHESFEVFCSWRGEHELLRTRTHALYFDELWKGRDETVNVASLDIVTREQLLAVADPDLEHAINEVRAPRAPALPPGRSLLPHQVQALASWEAAGYRGIVNFATGAGKTLTAIEAIRRWTTSGRPALVLVPGADLHRQWVSELAAEAPDMRLLLAGAGSSREDWERLLPTFVRNLSGTARHAVVATMRTFASAGFQDRLAGAESLLLVVDEVHRAGSRAVLIAIEQTTAAATMGLSATYSRQWDSPGTQRLLAALGPVLDPVIGIAEAIALGLLVPYDYRLHTLKLFDDERLRYEELTNKVRRLIAEGADVAADGDSYLRMLLLQRARILKQARGKVAAAVDVLVDSYRPRERWLVYCDSQDQLRAILAECSQRHLSALEFHSQMTGDRAVVLDSLGGFGGIVVAIRCLDEGVDIPACDNALIVASSTVGREYIQRRGRVLRRAPDKLSATVHDLLLVDEHGGALTRGEALRALDFARVARNPGARAQLALLLALSGDVAQIGQDLGDTYDDDGEDPEG